MKANLKGMLRSGMAVLLVLCMVVGYIPAVVFANADEGAKKENLNYVSLGDSMSNGYGLPGYDGHTGVEDYGNGSYANLFAEEIGWLRLAMQTM